MSKHRVSSQRIAPVAISVLLLAACGGSGGGKTGAAGTSGGAGTTGAGGSTGDAGTTGTAGATGTAGTAGTGAAGSTGAAGAAGTGGSTGAAGVAGTGGTTGQGGAAGSPSGAAGSSPDAGTGGSKDASTDAPSGPFALTSTAFTEGMEVPLMYKCAQVPPVGMNISPPLSWTPGPAGTKSYAITLNHVASGSAHWALWDIPVDRTSLDPNVEHVANPPMPAGAKQAMQNLDGFTGIGYLGPCPQAVSSRQMYRYTVWALKVATLTGVTSASTTGAAQTAIKNAALTGGSATLTGTQIQTP